MKLRMSYKLQSLEQQFDYLFKCVRLKLISCWDLKKHHIIKIIIKNQKGKMSIEFPESSNSEKSYFICLQSLLKLHRQFLISGGSSVGKRWSSGHTGWCKRTVRAQVETLFKYFFSNDFYFSFIRPNGLQ